MTSLSLGRLGGLGLLASCADGSEDALAGTDGVSQSDSDPNLPAVKNGISVVVIGSGYGSAVTAARLTEAGIPVTMLEAGRLWAPGPDGTTFCKPFSPDGRAMWFKDQTETNMKSFLGFPVEMKVPVEAGIMEARGPESMRAFQGKGVGGGSLINMAIYLQPDRAKLRSTLPMVNANEFYNRHLRRALGRLGAGSASQRLINSEAYRYTRVGMAFAEKAGFRSSPLQSGYDFKYMEQELDNKVPKSALGGEAGFGNNYGKRSLDKTYLADALGTGLLTVHALHVVKRITVNPSGGYVVEADQIDLLGKVLETKQFPCTHLFLGAGSMATSELLVRARERGDLPNLNKEVGTKWGPNGDLFIALDNPLGQPTGALQSTIPSHYFVARDGKNRRVVSQYAPIPMGLPLWQSLIIMIADNPEAGYFKYDSTTDSANLVWDRSQNTPSTDAAKFIFDQVNAKARTSYSQVIKFLGDAQFGDTVTYHPVGGVPLGAATDEYGRIREYPGLYVNDGSLIPIGIGANPSLSITALAERNIERLLATDFAA